MSPAECEKRFPVGSLVRLPSGIIDRVVAITKWDADGSVIYVESVSRPIDPYSCHNARAEDVLLS